MSFFQLIKIILLLGNGATYIINGIDYLFNGWIASNHTSLLIGAVFIKLAAIHFMWFMNEVNKIYPDQPILK